MKNDKINYWRNSLSGRPNTLLKSSRCIEGWTNWHRSCQVTDRRRLGFIRANLQHFCFKGNIHDHKKPLMVLSNIYFPAVEMGLGFFGCSGWHLSFSLSNSVILHLEHPVRFISHAHGEALVRFQARLLWKGQEICLFFKCIFSSLVSEELWAVMVKPGHSLHSIMTDISIRFHC